MIFIFSGWLLPEAMLQWAPLSSWPGPLHLWLWLSDWGEILPVWTRGLHHQGSEFENINTDNKSIHPSAFQVTTILLTSFRGMLKYLALERETSAAAECVTAHTGGEHVIVLHDFISVKMKDFERPRGSQFHILWTHLHNICLISGVVMTHLAVMGTRTVSGVWSV